MTKYVFVLCFTFLNLVLAQAQSKSQPQIISTNPSCEVEMVQIGKGSTTPLHQEAEWILQQKGYTLISSDRSSVIELPAVKAVGLRVEYAAGNESRSGESDCLVEDYHEFGKRSTCQYELRFYATDMTGYSQLAFHVRQSIRQELDATSFYDQVRAEMARLPACVLVR